MSDRHTRIICYFCSSQFDEVEVMIVHDDIGICSYCVHICEQIVREHDWNQRYERWKEFGP